MLSRQGLFFRCTFSLFEDDLFSTVSWVVSLLKLLCCVYLRYKGGWIIFHFSIVLFYFLLSEFNFTFSISKVLTFHVYYYCIWLGYFKLFSCLFAGCFQFSPKGSVKGVTSRLEWEFLLYFNVTSFRFHASSFPLLLLRLCNGGCAEAFVVKEKKSHLN